MNLKVAVFYLLHSLNNFKMFIAISKPYLACLFTFERMYILTVCAST